MNHFKILKEFQGCLSIQLSKNCIAQTQYLSGVLSLICYRLPRRLVYNIIRSTHCQQLFSIFFKKVVISFKYTIYRGLHHIYIQVISAFLLYYILLLCLVLSFLLLCMDCQLQHCALMRFYQSFPTAIPLYEAGYPRVTHPSATKSAGASSSFNRSTCMC